MLTPLYFLAIALAIWYMFRFAGYELIVLAVLLDGYFGAFYAIPYISLVTVFLVFIIELLKPFLLMYTE